MDRRERVLAGLPKGLGLEIGPSYCPIAAGDPALDVRTLDHLDQAALIEKFSKANVDVSRIQPVDYVWSGERYIDLVGDTRFDWVLASHVIEHVPDLVGFVNECAEILKPGGVLSLLVPDRRYEFDYYRPPAGLGSVIDAHLQNRRLSSPGLAAEFTLYMSQLDGLDTWGPERGGKPRLRNEDWAARSMLKRAGGGEYVDIHAWVFTAHSFRLLIEDLHRLELLKLREAGFHATNGFEFFIELSADGSGPGLSRLELCNRALAETRPPAPAPSEVPIVHAPDSAATQRLADENLSLTEELAAYRNSTQRLVDENLRLTEEMAAYRASTSWRVTAPLRAVRRLAG